MKIGHLKRVISALLVLCVLLGMLPASSFAALRTREAAATRAATDLTSTINDLLQPVSITNTLYRSSTNATNDGSYAGTFYIFVKDASGKYHVVNPLGKASNGNLATVPATYNNSTVSGADLSMAFDIVHSSGNTYHFRTSDGRYLSGYVLDSNPSILVTSTPRDPFGFQFITSGNAASNTSTSAYILRIYRLIEGQRYDMRYDGSGEIRWNVTDTTYDTSESFYVAKIAQRWDTSELYDAIQTMKSYASANNGRYAEGIHEAFMDCMEKSIDLYKKYNVATSSQTYDQIVAIRSELKAQTQWLLSYKDVLQASYADAAAKLPTPHNTYVPVSWGDLTINKMALLNGDAYYIVNRNADGTAGHMVDLSQDYFSEDLMVAQSVTIEDDRIVNADPNCGIYFETTENVYCTVFRPVQGLRVGLETTEEGSPYHKIVYYTVARDFEFNPFADGLYINVHPGGKDVNKDGRNDRYALNYMESENGFRLMLDLVETQTATNTMHLYRLSTQSIELYKAIIRLAPYATGNGDERYPAGTYNDFLTCLTDSIALYQQYNVALNTTDEANFDQIHTDMKDKAAELREYLSTLTRQDSLTEFIDIPVEIYDFRADGLLFEYLNQHYNLASVNPSSNLTPPGNWSDHGRINLTDLTLTNRKITYKKEVVTFVAESMYDENALSNVNGEGYAAGWNSAFYHILPTVSETPWEKGSYEETIGKTQNGGELLWSKVSTYYDLAYYLLTYLWRPVNPGDIVDTENNLPYNVTVSQRDRLRLYADENGEYLLDAADDVLYDGYYIYNPTPRAPEDITYASALFTPANGLGFESPEILATLDGDTDRGDMYETHGFATENTNFHFSMHAYGSFVYYEDQDQYFDFVGDDDVYFFINGKMALDLGGAHQALGKRIELNDLAKTLGLEDDHVYDFDMFYAERHTTASNLRFSTNIKIVDTDTITTMGQYAQTYNGSSKVDETSGMGQSVIDNGAVYVGDTIAYSFDLTNTRNLPVYDISFVSPTLGTNISGNGLTLYKSALTNGAETSITDITVYYRTVTRDENGTDVIHSSDPVVTSYSSMQALLSDAINKNTTLHPGSYRVSISSVDELQTLLRLGIPHNCQISVYGFKRNTTQNDTPFTNTLISQCYYTREASNEGSAGGEVFTLNGSVSRKVRVSANLPGIDPQQIVLDYGKPVKIPVKEISESIYTDSFVTVTGLAGITLSGDHGQVLKNVPEGLACTTAESTLRTENGIFTRTEDGLRFDLTDFFDAVETVNLVYSLEGCELTDPDGGNTVYKYILVQLQLIPATAMYYETDFAKGVFDLVEHSRSLFFDFGNEEVDRIRYSSPTYGGYNFDQAEEGYWATRSTRTDKNATSDFSIDNKNGTISIDVAPGRPYNDTSNYGPWFTTTAKHGSYPANNVGSYHPLRYDPSDAQVVQIRFKVDGCSVTRDGDPRVVVVYNYMKNGALNGREYSMVGEYTYQEGAYRVVTIPVSTTFQNADCITTFGFRFWDLQSTNNGKVTVDYIYVGRLANMPQPENAPEALPAEYLLFDFTDSAEDQLRYEDPVYGGFHFDRSNWVMANGTARLGYTIDPAAGTVALNVANRTSDYGPYFATSNSHDGYPYNGHPNLAPLMYPMKGEEELRIRFKVEDCEIVGSSNGKPKLSLLLHSTVDGAPKYVTNLSQDYTYTNGQYFELTFDLSKAYQAGDLLHSVGFRFYYLNSSSGGKITIDYIYLGPKGRMPTGEPLYVDFTNTVADQERYQSVKYNGKNLDLAENWAVGSAFKKTMVVDATGAGTLNLEQIDDYKGNGWHHLQAGTPASPQGLNFIRSKDDVFQIRMKIEDASLINTNNERADAIRIGFGFASDESTTINYHYANVLFKEYANKGYFTLTLSLDKKETYLADTHTTTIRPYIHFLGAGSSAPAKIEIDYIYLGPKDKIEETLHSGKHVWHTVTDGTSPDEYQDVDMVHDGSTTSYVLQSEVASEMNAKPETKGKEEASRAAASIDLPDGVTVENRTEYTLAEGVTETIITEKDNKLAVYIAEIDAGSKTALKASTPGYYTVGSTEESRVADCYSIPNSISYVVDQAKAYEAATDERILFAMNGSFFSGQEVNRGPLVLEGNVLQGCFGTLKEEPIFALMKDGTYKIIDYTDDFADVEEGIGARHWLLKDGVNVIADDPESDNLIHVLHPRTAIGLKADGSVVCIVVDGRAGAGYTTNGITLPDLADLMLSLGCVDAVNLDGGGSSTFVTRRSENENLTMRNKSSDSAGRRKVASALMFISTEEHCSHTYENNDYRMLSEGRHELLCDSCRQGIDSPHRYTNGVCICGRKEEPQTNLLFDFSNQPGDRERYNNAAYGYHNFDMPSSAKDEVDTTTVTTKWTWWRGHWATQATDGDLQHRKDFIVDTNAGVLRVDVADYTGTDDTGTLAKPAKPYGDSYNYGPFIMTAPVYYQWSRQNYDIISLRYDPAEAETMQVRFKLENCAKTNTPQVILLANYEKDGTNAEFQKGVTYTYADNEYIVVDVPLDNTFRSIDCITSLGLRFNNIYSTALEDSEDQGAVVIDYIYLGKEANAPTCGNLFIDFTNTKADQERYATHTFSGLNLDLAENWTPMPNFKEPVISDGVMTLTHKYNTINNGYVTPGNTLEARPLNYIPSADDYLQIRLKIDGAVSTAASANGRFVLFYADDTGNTVPGNDNFVAYNFPIGTILDQGWVTLTLKISDMVTNGKNFTQYDSISRISPGFYWLKSAEGEFASFHIDYIYIGSEEGLPSFDRPVYGYDSSYTDDSKLSNGSSLFIKGEGIPSIVKDKDGNPASIDYAAADLYTETSFTFTGTGFDIISRTGANQGLIRAVVFGSDGKIVKNVSVINKGESELYQIPVLSVEGLTHGTYTVKLFVDEAFDYGNDGNNDIFGGGMDRGGEFYFDAVRIYNPMNTLSTDADSVCAYEVYQKHGEADPTITEVRDILIDANNFTAGSSMNGVVYLDATAKEGTEFDDQDGKLAPKIAEYRAIGPNNEVYLSPGNAIAFKLEVEGPIPASIDIGAKSANGADVSMVASVTKTIPTTLPTGSPREIQTATALFYPLNIFASQWQTVAINGTDTHSVYVTIYNSGEEGILSITDMKYAYDAPNSAKPEGRKLVRFVVDQQMLDLYTSSCQHQWNRGEVTTAPTCTAEGIKTFTCTTCGIFYTETVPALGHSYINGVCSCGQAEVQEPIQETSWKLNHSLNLASDISVNFLIPKTLLEGFDMTTVYVESVIDTYEGNEKTGTATIRIAPVESEYYYYFTLNGLTAVQMDDKISSIIYGTKDGRPYYSATDEYSIATYAYSQMDKAGVAESLKTLCADLLRYGAKAQIFKGYRTDSLADAAMTDGHKVYLSDMSKVNFGNTNTVVNDLSNPVIRWAGKALELNSKVTLKFIFDIGSYTESTDALELRVTYKDYAGQIQTKYLSGAEAYGDIPGRYAFSFDGLLAAELRSVVSVQIYVGNEPVSCTLQYSADTYGNNKTGTLQDLCKALLAYSDSAKAFFAP